MKSIILANVALPAFLPHSFATLFGIFFIAVIEGWFLMRFLNLSFGEGYRLSLFANWKSTIAGIPVAWLLWTGGLIPVALVLNALRIEPHPAVSSTLIQTAMYGGIIPTKWTATGSAAAWIVLLIPFWFGSVWIERRTIRKKLQDCDRAMLSKAVICGNLASYSFFLLIGVIGLAEALGLLK